LSIQLCKSVGLVSFKRDVDEGVKLVHNRISVRDAIAIATNLVY